MDLFKKKPPADSPPTASAEVQGRLEALERAVKSVRLEWEDTLDRLTRIMGRLNARAARSQDAPGPLEDPAAGVDQGFDYLTAQRELARRKRDGLLRRPG